MTKKIKLGLSASVAFALMFTTSVSVVAQENMVVSAQQEEVQASLGEGCAFKNVQGLYMFNYIGDDFTEQEVEKATNWQYDAAGSPECDDTDEQACVIWVSSGFVNNPSTSPSLSSTINLVATEEPTTGTHYVTGSADSAMQYSNQSAP